MDKRLKQPIIDRDFYEWFDGLYEKDTDIEIGYSPKELVKLGFIAGRKTLGQKGKDW